MDDNYKTPLIKDAIRMAARNLDLPEGAVFHSDRGSNYTSSEFAKALKELKIHQSVGRTGICYDNALAESLNGTLKNELVYRTVYPTRERLARTLHGGSSFAIIGLVSTRDSATELPRKFWTST